MSVERVRMVRAPQVAVPPATNAPLEVSRESRQQLRAARHRAFERHQQNAQWTSELLRDDALGSSDAGVAMVGATEELERKLALQKGAIAVLEREVNTQREANESAQQRYGEVMTALRSISTAEDLDACRTRVDTERALLLPKAERKLEVVKL